ncbi:hypothetical protein JZ751_003879 [Albula glossodonta]|uniref:Uncharacterized protein n=1 Tax=Albula glossodonta TaxID=121402 RepID=A0A8T2P350_9TELE|nr:hypothetical protein JZ751_003879 [Albula glossodonta]
MAHRAPPLSAPRFTGSFLLSFCTEQPRLLECLDLWRCQSFYPQFFSVDETLSHHWQIETWVRRDPRTH